MHLHQRGRRPAAAAAEMAILLPFVVFLFVVAADFCRVFYYSQTVQNCAAAGALYASGTAACDPSTTACEAAKQAAVAEGASLQPALTTSNVSVNIGSSVATVTVSYPFRTITGYPGLPGTLTIARTVQMPVMPSVGQ